ncbi:MAG: hypothetical protein OXI67_01780 [Candidatus Poribacteria bacterium]|nr:hypothetical protein [Candidatus Poribacteria bacterium]
MAKRHTLHLSDEQLEELCHLRDTGEPAYLRGACRCVVENRRGDIFA